MSLNPSDKAMERLAKPVNRSGQKCPLWRKPVSKVCHTCEFWQPTRLTVNGEEEIVWKCAFNWQPTLQLLTQQTQEMVERETVLMRSNFMQFRGAIGNLVGQMAQASKLIEEVKPPAQLEAIEENGEKKLSGPAV